MPEETRYQGRIAEGICAGCGKRKPAEGRVRCGPCLRAVREATAQRAAEMIKRGRCRTCGSRPAKEGHRDCASCLRRYADYAARRKRPHTHQ